MFPKKICSLGILDININLVLRKSLAENYNFNINKYNCVEDLESLFFPNEKNNSYTNYNNYNIQNNEEINYMDYISLSSNNNLINTLLYINRAYKTKTFVEFIMLNQMEFSESTKFVRKLLQEIFNKNYFFIIENKILDIPSKIKFIIKILNDNDDKIISIKSFELFEINDIEVEQNDVSKINENIDNNFIFQNIYTPILDIDKINYNFLNTNYFLFNLSVIKDLKLPNNKDFSNFIYEIIKRYPKIKIILIIDDNVNSLEKKDLKLNKKLIELSDIIFAFQEKLNNFFNVYNLTIKHNTKNSNLNENIDIIGNKKAKKNDLILDDQDKYRKNIPRLTILFDNFNCIHIYYQQGVQMKIDYIETFPLTIINNKNSSKMEYLCSNTGLFSHIFIAGFLSRLIHEKSLRVCVGAGDLLMKKSLFLFINNIDYINDIDQFNVLVPNIKKNKKRKISEKIIKEYKKLVSKENKFILDCTNMEKSKKKEYNSLLDANCASYLLKNQNMKHLKNIGFINKSGVILNDPDIMRKNDNKNNNILNNFINKRTLTDVNFFLRNNKLPYSKTIYNTINNNFDNLEINNKNTPKFKRIFNPISEKQIYDQKGFLSPIIKTKTDLHLPKMSKTIYKFSNKKIKDENKNQSNLRKSKSTSSKNVYTIIKPKRNKFLYNNKYGNDQFLFQMLKINEEKSNYFPKILKKIFTSK